MDAQKQVSASIHCSAKLTHSIMGGAFAAAIRARSSPSCTEGSSLDIRTVR